MALEILHTNNINNEISSCGVEMNISNSSKVSTMQWSCDRKRFWR